MATNTDRSEAHQPTTDTVRARYYLATVPDDLPDEILEMGRARSYAEFDSWLAKERKLIEAQVRAELSSDCSKSDQLEANIKSVSRSDVSEGTLQELDVIATRLRTESEAYDNTLAKRLYEVIGDLVSERKK